MPELMRCAYRSVSSVAEPSISLEIARKSYFSILLYLLKSNKLYAKTAFYGILHELVVTSSLQGIMKHV